MRRVGRSPNTEALGRRSASQQALRPQTAATTRRVALAGLRVAKVRSLRPRFERRDTAHRPGHDDARACPTCGGVSRFVDAPVLLRPGGGFEPGWICDRASCGMVEFVRSPAGEHRARLVRDLA